jgi:hypothetical protein
MSSPPPDDRAQWSRLPVTIIAGFFATPKNATDETLEFALLAADSEEGTALTKSSVRKIAQIDTPAYKCLIGGAGNGDFIDLAVQESAFALAAHPPSNLTEFRLTLEKVVTSIYKDKIDTFPLAEQETRGFELLCAIWVPTQVQLISVGRSFSLVRHKPVAIGVGGYLARYILARFYEDNMPIRLAVRLAAYLVGQVKTYSQACGGATQAVAIYGDGRIAEVSTASVASDEAQVGMVMNCARVLFYATDPVLVDGNVQSLKERVDGIVGALKTDLENFLQPQSLPVVTPSTPQMSDSPSPSTAALSPQKGDEKNGD